MGAVIPTVRCDALFIAELEATTRDDIVSFVTEWLSDHRIPGASVVVDADETRYAEGFGAQNFERNIR